MAEKRKHLEYNDDSEIYGYIHSTTDLQVAKTSNTRYFSGTLQTGVGDFVRYVSFSPEKLGTVQSAQTSRTPVKMTNVQIMPKGNTKEIIIKKTSTITAAKKLPFEVSTKSAEIAKIQNLGDLKAPDTMCSVKVKVVRGDESNSVTTKYGPRMIKKVNVADETSAMNLCLWEKHIDCVQVDNYYSIQNLITTSYQGQLQLSTTGKSTFKRVQPFPVTSVPVINEKQMVFTGTVLCCNLTETSLCVACGKAMEIQEQACIQKCNHCFNKQKASQKKRKLNLHTKNENGTKKFVVFEEVLTKFLHANNVEDLNKDEVENYILDIDTLSFKYNEHSDVITEFVNTKEDEEACLLSPIDDMKV